MKPCWILAGTFSLAGCMTVILPPEKQPEHNPIDIAEARIELGLNYLANNQPGKAHNNLTIAMRYAPDYYRSQLSMAYYYETIQEEEPARRLYRAALRQHPDNATVLHNYASFLCKQGDYAQADKLFLRAIHQPGNSQTAASYENAAFCALKSGQTRHATHYFQRALIHDPTRAKSRLQLARLALTQGEFTLARTHLTAFHQRYGYQKASLPLLIELERRTGHPALVKKYQQMLIPK